MPCRPFIQVNSTIKNVGTKVEPQARGNGLNTLGAQGRRWAKSSQDALPGDNWITRQPNDPTRSGINVYVRPVLFLSCAPAAQALSAATMSTFLYRRPTTGYQAQS
jgi:hypothetical protein